MSCSSSLQPLSRSEAGSTVVAVAADFVAEVAAADFVAEVAAADFVAEAVAVDFAAEVAAADFAAGAAVDFAAGAATHMAASAAVLSAADTGLAQDLALAEDSGLAGRDTTDRVLDTDALDSESDLAQATGDIRDSMIMIIIPMSTIRLW